MLTRQISNYVCGINNKTLLLTLLL